MIYKVCFKWPEMSLFSELFYSKGNGGMKFVTFC